MGLAVNENCLAKSPSNSLACGPFGFLSADDFLKVKETLTRIGVASRKDKTLYQSCHILHKKGKYYTYLVQVYLVQMIL